MRNLLSLFFLFVSLSIDVNRCTLTASSKDSVSTRSGTTPSDEDHIWGTRKNADCLFPFEVKDYNYKISLGYCPFLYGPRSRTVMQSIRVYDSNKSPNLATPKDFPGPVNETYVVGELNGGEEISLELGRSPLMSPTSAVFPTNNAKVLVKYQSNCLNPSEVHPLARDFIFLDYLQRAGVGASLRALYLSGAVGIPEKETFKTQFAMTRGARESCMWKGGSVRFMVMERGGKNLYEFAREFPQGRVPLDIAKSIGIKLLEALQKIHAKGIVHNDVHWGNVVFNPEIEGEVMLIDFGRSFFVPASEPLFKLHAARSRNSPHLSPWETLGFHPGFRDDVYRALMTVSLLVVGHGEWTNRVLKNKIRQHVPFLAEAFKQVVRTEKSVSPIDIDALIALFLDH